MHAILDTLLAQHRNLSRLVALLDCQPSLEPDPQAPHVGLLLDVMVYLTSFPDVSHHPLEDRIAERLLQRGALDRDLCAELEAQHARLTRQGADLLRDMEGAMRRESMAMDVVALNTRLYAERLRHNIAFEELVLFPAAARHFGQEDWQAIAPADGPAADPLCSADVEGRFEGLRQVITKEADCGCD
ncbi:MAG TPA: hemerythrin domain-containing protein [Ramlibacter sp.]